METTLETKVYQSRWGFHPCDYETFLKLKKLNKLYFQALKKKAAWDRWNRKQPQNRILFKYKRDISGKKIGKEIFGPKPEPNIDSIFLEKKHITSKWYGEYDVVYLADYPIMETYQEARKPRKKKDVQPLGMSVEKIEELYNKTL